MNSNFFQNLSTEDARMFLNDFLMNAASGFKTMGPEMVNNDIVVDYTVESVFPVFKWILRQLKTLPEKEDENIPEWIRVTESYKKGLYSFEEVSKVLILRFAFYMGESFVKDFETLHWSLGKSKTMQKNMPVITGFKSKMEMAVLVVSHNMFATALEDKETDSAETAIETWRSFTL